MSVKGEKYSSPKAMKMHEAKEGPKARKMEYGSAKKAAPKKKMGKKK